MNDILTLAKIQIVVIASFLMNKIVLRPFVLEYDFAEMLNIFALSYSNFCETIVGYANDHRFLLITNQRWVNLIKIQKFAIYLMATVLAEIYVT